MNLRRPPKAIGLSDEARENIARIDAIWSARQTGGPFLFGAFGAVGVSELCRSPELGVFVAQIEQRVTQLVSQGGRRPKRVASIDGHICPAEFHLVALWYIGSAPEAGPPRFRTRERSMTVVQRDNRRVGQIETGEFAISGEFRIGVVEQGALVDQIAIEVPEVEPVHLRP